MISSCGSFLLAMRAQYKKGIKIFSVKILKLPKSMYSDITTGVRLSNGITDLFLSKIGVRQGCNLSPILFNLFTNDIVDSVGNGQNALYPPGKLNNISIACYMLMI